MLFCSGPRPSAPVECCCCITNPLKHKGLKAEVIILFITLCVGWVVWLILAGLTHASVVSR